MSSVKTTFWANFGRRIKATVVSLAILQGVALTVPTSMRADGESTTTIGYTELLSSVKENKVQKIDIESNGLAAEAVLKDGKKVRVDLVARDGNTELMKALRENNGAAARMKSRRSGQHLQPGPRRSDHRVDRHAERAGHVEAG